MGFRKGGRYTRTLTLGICERLATTHQPVTARLIDFIQVQDPDETSITHLQIGSQPSEKGTFPWNFGKVPMHFIRIVRPVLVGRSILPHK